MNVLEIDKPTYQWLIVYSNYITFQEIECSVPILDRKLVVSPIKEKYRVGDLLEFSCHSGHRVGPDSVQCYHFGWSPGFPTCKGQYVFYTWSVRIRSFSSFNVPHLSSMSIILKSSGKLTSMKEMFYVTNTQPHIYEVNTKLTCSFKCVINMLRMHTWWLRLKRFLAFCLHYH